MATSGRIRIVGADDAQRSALADAIAGVGDVAGREASEAPVLVVVCAAAGELGRAVAAVRADPRLGDTPVVGVASSSDPEELAAGLAAGAADVVALSAVPALRARVKRQLVAARCQRALAAMTEIVASRGETWPGVRDILKLLADATACPQIAMIIIHDEAGWIVDLEARHGPLTRRVDLARFPEITAVAAGLQPLLPGAMPPSELSDRLEELSESGLGVPAVFPLVWRGRSCGGVAVYPKPGVTLLPEQVALARTAAGQLGHLVFTGPLRRGFRERTIRLGSVDDVTKPLPVSVEQFQAYFEAASDGIVVAASDGRVLFVNRAAEALTGYARESLLGRPLTDLVPEEERRDLDEVIAQVIGGTNLDAFDLTINTTSHDRICVSVSTSTVLAQHGAAILSFRDVTSERLLEAELRKTKEFLEKLIDSTVDAIIAADVDGQIILFNPGAERMFGWPAEDVIGRMPVERLYPEGLARQVMRMLRSPSYGGVGRLELTRREIVTAAGELVPVNMTESIIYENGREVATVGILSDLRDRIRIEQRLLQAQEKLLVTEKQALVAELAGTAAHELNQPLTSVLLYAEQMQKRMAEDDPHARAIGVILSETIRMAEIVKKIGQITRYETKQYVGSASILDLDKSANPKETES